MVVLLGVFALIPARGDEVADGLISAINNATTMKCVKWELVLNGDGVYYFKSDVGDNVHIMVKRAGHQGKFAFIELRFSQNANFEKYVLRDKLGASYSKLKELIEKIKLNDIEEKNVKTTLPYLIKHL